MYTREGISPVCRALWLGRVEYGTAWQLQRELAALRQHGLIPDVLLLLEHPPTITVGRSAGEDHILVGAEELARSGVAVHSTDRGGQVTYHGPGQLVGYPIFDLNGHGRDLHRFLRTLEEALIAALDTWSVEGRRFPPHTGVWVGDRKIAAIGLKVSRWVTTHGFALNVAPDLGHFRYIVPCGIREYGVTSLEQVTGTSIQMSDVVAPVARALARTLGLRADSAGWLPAEGLSEGSRKILDSALDAYGPLC